MKQDHQSKKKTTSPKVRRERLRALEAAKKSVVAEKRGDGRGYSLEGMRFATLLNQLQALQALQGLGELSTDDNAPEKRHEFSEDATERANQYQWLTFKADWLESLLEDTIDKLEALVAYEQEHNASASEENERPSGPSRSAE